jgi:hypothetical protein
VYRLSFRALVTGIAFALILNAVPAAAAVKIVPGKSCRVLKQKVEYRNKTFTCIKSAGKLVWNKGSSKPKTNATKPPSIPPAEPKKICQGSATNSVGKFNLELQLLDPFDNSRNVSGSAIFINDGSGWKYIDGNHAGVISLALLAGTHQIQVLPPMRTPYYTSRTDYVLEISASGEYQINGAELRQNRCALSAGISAAGKARNTEVRSSGYVSSVKPVAVNNPLTTISYIAPKSNRLPNQVKLDLYPWESKHFVLLTISNEHNPVTIGKLLAALDSSYELYDQITGNFPKYSPTTSNWSRAINGKSVIAEIPSYNGLNSWELISCGGNACTAVSTLGIEIRWEVLQTTLWLIEHLDVYDQTLFYELGRTFWPQNSCASKLSFKENDPTITGFAVLMRYVIMNELKLPIGSEEERSGTDYEQLIVALEQKIAERTELNLANVFLANKVIDGFDRNANWASIMMYLGKNFGGIGFYNKFFATCNRLSTPISDAAAITNWQLQAEYAANRELSAVFNTRWKKP